MNDRRIKFTWGGSDADGKYTAYLRFTPGLTGVYEPVVFGLESCYDAQQFVQRANESIRRWSPGLLMDGAELPGVGFQYPKPINDKMKMLRTASVPLQ